MHGMAKGSEYPSIATGPLTRSGALNMPRKTRMIARAQSVETTIPFPGVGGGGIENSYSKS